METSHDQTQPAQDHPDVIAWPPLIFLTMLTASIAAHFIAPQALMGYPWSLFAGVALMALAGALAIWAEKTMKAAGTNVRPDRPALTVVSRGPYRWTRNPMYVSLCVLQLAVAFFLNDWAALLFVIPLGATLHFGVILREEKYLGAKFGVRYLDYRRHVHRWI